MPDALRTLLLHDDVDDDEQQRERWKWDAAISQGTLNLGSTLAVHFGV